MRQFDSGRAEVQAGGGGAQPQQDPRHRHPQQLGGVRGGVALPARLPHEPSPQVRALVTHAGQTTQTKDNQHTLSYF